MTIKSPGDTTDREEWARGERSHPSTSVPTRDPTVTVSHAPRPIRRGLALVLALTTALLVVPLTPAAADTATDQEREFVAQVNVARAERGLHALTVRSDLRSVARSHSTVMAAERDLHHNPTLAEDVTGWQRVAENVGTGPSVSALHQALMDSDGHRRNILDDTVTEIGVGVERRDGRTWVTQVFRRPSTSVVELAASTTRFGDVPSDHPHAAAILSVAERGITEGCSETRFCPDATLTRAQAASLLDRALDLPDAGDPGFVDVSGVHAESIAALADAEITAGCTQDRFCPDERLTRAQLASLLARALELDAGDAPFTDVGGTHADAIGALYEAGITRGCTATRFCAADDVDRAHTATLLDRAL